MNYYPALKKRGITPVIEITDEKIIRNLYPTYVERIMSNLISNAIKYSDGDLEVSLSEEGVMRIANSASELDHVKVEKLFDRYYTVENGTSVSTGIGLSIVRSFAEKMDCPISAEYDNGKLVITIEF